jgi:sugar O-acyltransferase (sialic acid O-acetyltransferase NeuD family)
MIQVGIFGASGCGRSVMPLARQQWIASGKSYQLVFVDDNPTMTECNGHKVLTYTEWISQSGSHRYINIAIANGSVRQRLVQRCLDSGVQFFEVRAANVVQLDEVQIGEGATLCPFVTLTSNILIGKHFHANIYSYVEHDCVIGDYVTFAPGVMCNGNVVVEDCAYIGAGAVIKQGQPGAPLIIGRGAVVGMGAVVTKSVPAGVTVVGNPARPLIKN